MRSSVLVALAAALAGAGEFRAPPPDHPWSFPADHRAHPGYRNEWWYFTGTVEAEGEPGRRLGFQVTFFRVRLLAEAPPRINVIVADIETWNRGRGAFDLVASVGSPAQLSSLAGLVRPGGLVLYGDGYWRREPTREYLEALGASRDELEDYAGAIRRATDLGLTPLYAVTASVDDFDRYEWSWSLNGERYAAENPDEPGVGDFLDWIRAGRRRYVELGGRDTLGFGLFLFRAGG